MKLNVNSLTKQSLNCFVTHSKHNFNRSIDMQIYNTCRIQSREVKLGQVINFKFTAIVIYEHPRYWIVFADGYRECMRKGELCVMLNIPVTTHVENLIGKQVVKRFPYTVIDVDGDNGFTARSGDFVMQVVFEENFECGSTGTLV